MDRTSICRSRRTEEAVERSVTGVEILKRARLRITEKGRWCTGWLARDRRGVGCYAGGRAAVQWCAVGAVLYELEAARAWGRPYAEAMRRLDGAAVRLGADPERSDRPLPANAINDRGDHALVLRMFDEAIAPQTARGIR